ncbi:FHA domain-containing protein, partial [Myxococcota bacterium]|nr:FHA domain-containing protein [Myxococcota bacterium]
PLPSMPFEDIFKRHYSPLRETLSDDRHPGFAVLITLADTKLTHCAVLPSESLGGATNVWVLGRHSEADIYLPEDKSVSLRHAIIRVTSDEEQRPTLRLLDLNTPDGLDVEGVGQCEALTSTGPLFMRLGSYSLIFVPFSGDVDEWHESPEAAWESLPQPRILDVRDESSPQSDESLDEDEDENEDAHLSEGPEPMSDSQAGERPDQRQRKMLRRIFDDENSVVTVIPGASAPSRPISFEAEMPENTFAKLTLFYPGGSIALPVTAEQLDRGLLLGRYDRCDISEFQFLRNDSVSRVHLLIIREGDTILAIDTSSTNGTRVDSIPMVICELERQSRIELAGTHNLIWEELGYEDDEPIYSMELN